MPAAGLLGNLERVLLILLPFVVAALVILSSFPPESFTVSSWRKPGEDLLIPLSGVVWPPYNAAWGVEGFFHIPAAARIAIGWVVLAALWLRWGSIRWASPWLWAGGLGTCLFLFPVDYHNVARALGDSATLPLHLDAGDMFPAEVLICHLVQGLRELFAFNGTKPPSLSVLVPLAQGCGILYLLALAAMARVIARTPEEVGVLAPGLMLSAGLLQFFGYPETTLLAGALIPIFMLSLYCASEEPWKDSPWIYMSILLAGLLNLSHAAGVAVMPSLLLMLMMVRRGRLTWGFSFPLWKHLLAVAVLIILPFYLLVVRPHFQQNYYGNYAGGGDGIAFVPLYLDASQPGLVFYALFRWLHLVDLLSAFFVVAPLLLFAVPALAARGVLKDLLRRTPWDELRPMLPMLLAAAGCLSVVLLWNHDFTLWGDWNLPATWLVPAHIVFWVLLIHASRQTMAEQVSLQRIAPVLIVIQTVGFFAMYFQLAIGRDWNVYTDLARFLQQITP